MTHPPLTPKRNPNDSVPTVRGAILAPTIPGSSKNSLSPPHETVDEKTSTQPPTGADHDHFQFILPPLQLSGPGLSLDLSDRSYATTPPASLTTHDNEQCDPRQAIAPNPKLQILYQEHSSQVHHATGKECCQNPKPCTHSTTALPHSTGLEREYDIVQIEPSAPEAASSRSNGIILDDSLRSMFRETKEREGEVRSQTPSIQSGLSVKTQHATVSRCSDEVSRASQDSSAIFLSTALSSSGDSPEDESANEATDRESNQNQEETSSKQTQVYISPHSPERALVEKCVQKTREELGKKLNRLDEKSKHKLVMGFFRRLSGRTKQKPKHNAGLKNPFEDGLLTQERIWHRKMHLSATKIECFDVAPYAETYQQPTNIAKPSTAALQLDTPAQDTNYSLRDVRQFQAPSSLQSKIPSKNEQPPFEVSSQKSLDLTGQIPDSGSTGRYYRRLKTAQT